MCTDSLAPGSLRIRGRKAEVWVGYGAIYGSNHFLHNARVPPAALDLMCGKSGSNKSSELRV